MEALVKVNECSLLTDNRFTAKFMKHNHVVPKQECILRFSQRDECVDIYDLEAGSTMGGGGEESWGVKGC